MASDPWFCMMWSLLCRDCGCRRLLGKVTLHTADVQELSNPVKIQGPMNTSKGKLLTPRTVPGRNKRLLTYRAVLRDRLLNQTRTIKLLLTTLFPNLCFHQQIN